MLRVVSDEFDERHVLRGARVDGKVMADEGVGREIEGGGPAWRMPRGRYARRGN